MLRIACSDARRVVRHLLFFFCLTSSVALGGCVGIFDAELNNRGGYLDQKLDDRWIIADTKQMRVLRAYVLIGSLARMSRENYYKSERDLIAKHVNSAVNVAYDAYACAYARPGDCVYFDERMAELEVMVIRLAIAVFSKHENESLVSVLVAQAGDNAPLLKSVAVAGKVVDAATSAAEVVGSTGALIKSILSFGEAAYFTGRRAGALYRDSIELTMVATLGSLDVQCAAAENRLADFVPQDEDDAVKIYYQLYGAPDPTLNPCQAFNAGLALWQQGSGDLATWKEYLVEVASPFRQRIIPGEAAYIQASDLIWRACDQIAEGPPQLGVCLGHRGPEAEELECGINKNGQQPRVQANAEATRNNDALVDQASQILKRDQCRLILYGKTWASRQKRRGGADTRIYSVSAGKNFSLANRATQFIPPPR